jgi:class 3 adenylate cyclase
VAATGLPKATNDHALIMCQFAWKMKVQMLDVCKKLESVLGPGTADLCLRIGIHSGPVTAGVLRGDKSRFQFVW